MEIPSENFMHPEDSMSDLIFEPENTIRPEAVVERKKQLGVARRKLKDHELCWACGWTNLHQMSSSYNPRLKIVTTRENMGIWALGSKYLLKDFPNDGSSPGNDYVTHRFLQSQPNSGVPLLKEMQLLSKPTDKTYLLLMSRSESKSLSSIWPDVTIKQRLDLRKQMLKILQDLRKFTASGAQTVDGGKLSDYILGGCSVTRPMCKTIGFDTEEWFANIEEELRVGLEKIHETKDPIIIEREYQKLKSNFPKSEPYTLTHGDLTLGNIMVDENIQITEIIDWEHAGYYPWWAEWWFSRMQAQDGSRPLLKPVFPLLEHSMNLATFDTEVLDPVGKVIQAWQKCDIAHPHYLDRWLRPPFSASEPYDGEFVLGHMGGITKREHVIKRSP